MRHTTYTRPRPRYARREALQFARDVLFLTLIMGVLVFAVLESMAKQEEIDRKQIPDFCRAFPKQCDRPDPGPLNRHG